MFDGRVFERTHSCVRERAESVPARRMFVRLRVVAKGCASCVHGLTLSLSIRSISLQLLGRGLGAQTLIRVAAANTDRIQFYILFNYSNA